MRDVHPLAVGQNPPDQTPGLGVFGAAPFGLQPHFAVIDEQFGAGFEGLEDFGMRQRRAVLVSGPAVEIQAKARPGREFDRALGKSAEPQFWSLQIGKDPDRAPGIALHLADRLQPGQMVGVGAVTEIEPEHVDPGVKQTPDLFRARTGGAESGDDFRAALAPNAALSAATPVRQRGLLENR